MSELIRDAPTISQIRWIGFVLFEIVWFVLLVHRGQRNSAAIRQRDAGLPSPPLELGPRPAIVNGIAWAFLLTGCVIAIITA
jgi:hypothetical protein